MEATINVKPLLADLITLEHCAEVCKHWTDDSCKGYTEGWLQTQQCYCVGFAFDRKYLRLISTRSSSFANLKPCKYFIKTSPFDEVDNLSYPDHILCINGKYFES